MTIRIAAPCGGDGDLRSDGIKEGVGRGCPTAVMRDLQHIDGRQAPADEHRIDLLLDIAGQEEAPARHLAKEDDRHVVDAGPRVGRLGRHTAGIRPQHADVGVIDSHPITRRQSTGLDVPRGQLSGPGGVTGTWPAHARLVHATDAVARQEERQPGYMILVGVGEHQRVDPPVPRREALVERNKEAIRIGAAVDEQTAAA
jgi:hypothetical protein